MAAKTKTFHIHVIGDNTGETWTGDFETKAFIGQREQNVHDNLYRFFLGESNPHLASVNTVAIAEMLATLRVFLVKTPPWWDACGKGENMDDDNVLPAIYKEVKAFINEHEKAKAAKIKAAQDDLKGLGALGDGKKDGEE